ncbi:MAG: hypothetical protein WKF37_24040, partial [Bryobacteraceae bacterium]
HGGKRPVDPYLLVTILRYLIATSGCTIDGRESVLFITKGVINHSYSRSVLASDVTPLKGVRMSIRIYLSIMVIAGMPSAYSASLTTTAAARCTNSPADTIVPTMIVHGGGAIAACSGSVDNGQGIGSDSSNQSADIWSLHSSSDAQFTRTADSGNLLGSGASGSATFTNLYIPHGGSGESFVVFPWTLTGSLDAVGHAGATVHSAFTALTPGTSFNNSCELIAPGACVVIIHYTWKPDTVIGGLTLVRCWGPRIPVTARHRTSHTAELALSFFDLDGRPHRYHRGG